MRDITREELEAAFVRENEILDSTNNTTDATTAKIQKMSPVIGIICGIILGITGFLAGLKWAIIAFVAFFAICFVVAMIPSVVSGTRTVREISRLNGITFSDMKVLREIDAFIKKAAAENYSDEVTGEIERLVSESKGKHGYVEYLQLLAEVYTHRDEKDKLKKLTEEAAALNVTSERDKRIITNMQWCLVTCLRNKEDIVRFYEEHEDFFMGYWEMGINYKFLALNAIVEYKFAKGEYEKALEYASMIIEYKTKQQTENVRRGMKENFSDMSGTHLDMARCLAALERFDEARFHLNHAKSFCAQSKYLQNYYNEIDNMITGGQSNDRNNQGNA